MQQGVQLADRYQLSVAQWHSLSTSNGLPRMSDLLDSAIPAHQPWLAIVDVGNDGPQPIRLMGTALEEYFGADLTGQDFLSIVAAEAAGPLRAAHALLPSLPCGALFSGLCSTSSGSQVVLEGLGLPYAAKSNKCVVWHLHPLTRLEFSESGVQIIKVLGADWIDLGNGVPAPLPSR